MTQGKEIEPVVPVEERARALDMTYGWLVAMEYEREERVNAFSSALGIARWPEKLCPNCGALMKNARPNKRYCCDECRVWYNYNRQRRARMERNDTG